MEKASFFLSAYSLFLVSAGERLPFFSEMHKPETWGSGHRD